MKNFIKTLRALSIKNQITLSLISFLAYGFVNSILEKSYVASKFPVPFFVGQTSFDAEKIQEWYQSMISMGTFDIYLRTQLIDFLFILSVVLMGFFIWTLIANLHHQDSFFRKWGYRMAFALPLAALFDALENFVSFVMMANPADVAQGLAVLYSTLASIKFGFWSIALIWMVISLLVLVGLKVTNLLKNKKKGAHTHQ